MRRIPATTAPCGVRESEVELLNETKAKASVGEVLRYEAAWIETTGLMDSVFRCRPQQPATASFDLCTTPRIPATTALCGESESEVGLFSEVNAKGERGRSFRIW